MGAPVQQPPRSLKEIEKYQELWWLVKDFLREIDHEVKGLVNNAICVELGGRSHRLWLDREGKIYYDRADDYPARKEQIDPENVVGLEVKVAYAVRSALRKRATKAMESVDRAICLQDQYIGKLIELIRQTHQ